MRNLYRKIHFSLLPAKIRLVNALRIISVSVCSTAIALSYPPYGVLDIGTMNKRLLNDITFNEMVVKVPSKLKPILLMLSLGEVLDILL